MPTMLRPYAAVAAARFRAERRYTAALAAGLVTNIMFGLIRTFLLLAVYDTATTDMGDYTRGELAATIWIGQAMLSLINPYALNEIGVRIKAGDIATDLLRPTHVIGHYASADLGRAAFNMLLRFIPHGRGGLRVFRLRRPAAGAHRRGRG